MMKEKICIVTGGNAGIGKMTAIGLAEKGAHTIIVCRNAEKGRSAVEEIRKTSGNDNVEYMTCDLSSQAQVRRLAEDFNSRFDRLDLLVNNAGAFYSDLQRSEDGIEMQFAINHLAYFLFTNLVIDKLVAAAPSRIVNVSSNAHYNGKIYFHNINGDKKGKYDGRIAYGQSKIANVLFTYELARRLAGTNVTANCLHPGVVRTSIAQKHASGFYNFMWTIMKPFMISVKKGAETTLHVATAPELEGLTGKYYSACKEKASAPLTHDQEVAKRLWELSEEMTGLKTSI